MAVNYRSIGAKIRWFREKRGFSQAALSELVACCPAHISHIERGTRIMSMETFVRLANVLQVSADELLADTLEEAGTPFDHAFAAVIHDCSEYEKRILLHVISETKIALQKNAAYVIRNRGGTCAGNVCK